MYLADDEFQQLLCFLIYNHLSDYLYILIIFYFQLSKYIFIELMQTPVTPSFSGSQSYQNTSNFLNCKDSGLKNKKVIIENRFHVKNVVTKHLQYTHYQGTEIQKVRKVNIYVKPHQTNVVSFSSNKVKEENKCTFSGSFIWSGTTKIDKSKYLVEVHQKLGPSLAAVMAKFKRRINQIDLLKLLYNLLKLVQKVHTAGYICRNLNPSCIVLDKDPQKNQLYLLNSFELKKKKQECQVLSTKYCSRASHLGIPAFYKDDLQSICYILIDIMLQGKFLQKCSISSYENQKGMFCLNQQQNYPSLFINFYNFVKNIGLNSQITYFYWKNLLHKTLGKQSLVEPYIWIKSCRRARNRKSQINSEPIKQQEEIQTPQCKEQSIVMDFFEELQEIYSDQECGRDRINKYVLNIKI